MSGSITWAGGTFVPAPIPVPPGAREIGDGIGLTNRVGFPDLFTVADQFTWEDENLNSVLSTAVLFLTDDFLADSAGIPSGNELPNFATATGSMAILSYSITRGESLSDVIRDGYQVNIDVTSVSRVPEPGTLVLLLAGGLLLLVRTSCRSC